MHLFWSECTWEEIEQASKERYVLVLPCGAIEQHGPMLPVDTDSYLATRWAEEAAQEAREKYGAKVLVLPPFHYGQSMRHLKFPGTISLSFETYIAALYEVMWEVVQQGFHRIVLSNGNGGNKSCIDVAQRKLADQTKRRDLDVRSYLLEAGGDPSFAEELRRLGQQFDAQGPTQIDFHASEAETSEYLAGREHLVHKDKITTPKIKVDSPPRHIWTTDEISDTGATGNPPRASKEIGEKYWELFRTHFGKFIAEVAEGKI